MVVEFSKGIALLLALCLVQGFIARRWTNTELIGQVLSGLLFGGICVIGMLTPIEVAPGVIFDTRSVMLSMAGLFGGPVIGGIAAAIAGGYRAWLGGGGAPVGVAVVLSCVLLGLGYRHCHRRGWLKIGIPQLLAFGLVVHLGVVYQFTFLPADVVGKVMENIAFPLILAFTPATALLGTLLHSIELQIQTAASLALSERRFKEIAESASDWIWEMGPDLRFTYFYDADQDLMDFDRTKQIGWKREDGVPQFELDGNPQKWAAHNADLEARRPFRNFEYISSAPQDGLRYVRINGTPVFGTDGSFLGYRGTGTDITERRRAEQALRDSEERYRDLIEGSILGIQIGSPDKGRIILNRSCAELFGYDSNDDLMKIPSAGLIAEHDRRRVAEYSRDLHEGNVVSITYEFDGIKRDGTAIPVQTFAQRISWEGDVAIQRTFVDLTERKRAETALFESDEKLRTAFENTGIGMSIRNSSDRTIITNNALGKILGYSQEELEALRLRDITHPDDREENQRFREKLLAGEIDSYQVTKRFIRKDGGPIWVINDLSTIRDDQGKVVFSINLFQDLTERKRTEDQLRQAQKMEIVGQLTGGVAHDFNNILAVVVGNLELAADRTKGNSEVEPLVDAALDAAWRSASLTQRLLAFSRKQALMPQTVDAHVLLEGMGDLLRRTLEETVGIEFMGSDDLWMCEVDPNQLENAILNLAINARDAMPDGGRLTIEAENVTLDDDYANAQADVAPGQYVMLAVTDTGAGMPQEIVDQVFDPFFTTKEIGSGSGLGLSMVFGFVKQSGGHVTIYSEEGVGTTVKLYLPRSQGEDATIPSAEPSEIPRGRGETILVVEDDPNVRTLSVALLSDLGYDVLEAADGPSALLMLETSSHVNLLFTDVVLPGGMRGPELAAEIMRRQPGIAVLYTSGYTENAIIHRGRLEEGVELLSKPFRREDLARKVRAVIDKSYA